MMRLVASSAASIRVVLRSIGIWALVALTVLVASVLETIAFVLFAPFDRRRIPGLYVMRLWARTLMRLNPMWHVHATGLDRLDPKGTYVFASNHQSHGDILVLGFLDHPYIYMAKRELFPIPFLGWGMFFAGCIAVRRGDKESARAAMSKAAAKLRQGVSLLIFPEGTRSRDGTVGSFKDGAFHLALQTGRAVVPVAIHGSRNALPKGSWLFTQKSHVEVEILPPISVEGLDESHLADLKARVHDVIVAKVAELAACGSVPELLTGGRR
jgi:1-acyl-sn-glycerol-3-phosphate acyltransferase